MSLDPEQLITSLNRARTLTLQAGHLLSGVPAVAEGVPVDEPMQQEALLEGALQSLVFAPVDGGEKVAAWFQKNPSGEPKLKPLPPRTLNWKKLLPYNLAAVVALGLVGDYTYKAKQARATKGSTVTTPMLRGPGVPGDPR